MKIAILGKGLAGVITALHWKMLSPGTEVELYYDEEIPTEPVGSGSFPGLTDFLADTFVWSFTWQNNTFAATPKMGIMYENWGTKGDWFHPFNFNTVGMHFDPHAFQDSMCNTGIFPVTQKHISSYNDIDADYIYDCTGSPKDYTDYIELKNPLNKVILSNTPNPEFVPWTRTVATPDGWCFVIHLKDRVQYGYLYNDTITTDEQAESNFKELFPVTKIVKKFPLRNYCAKNPVIDDGNRKIFLNGNKYFFIEPMEATSVAGYLKWTYKTMDVILDGVPMESALFDMQRSIKENSNFILYHYQFGSKYKTPFWDYAKTLTVDDPHIQNIIDMNLRTGMVTYGFHSSESVMNMYEGLQNIYTP